MSHFESFVHGVLVTIIVAAIALYFGSDEIAAYIAENYIVIEKP